MSLLSGGGYAQFCATDERLLMPVPEGFSLEKGAAVPETWLTAFQLLTIVGEVQEGDVVLVHAAGSGVGIAATQLAIGLGARVVAVALAVPPASDQGRDNPRAPFVGRLEARVAATRRLNAALERACRDSTVAFPGADAWRFAEDPATGGLRGDISDGHVHVAAAACGPFHARCRAAMLGAVT